MAIVEDMRIKVQTATDSAVVGFCYRYLTSLVENYEQFSSRLFEIFHELNCANAVSMHLAIIIIR